MIQKSLKERLQRYLFKYHGWIALSDILIVVAKFTNYPPEEVSQYLRELAEAGKIEAEDRAHNGKREPFYRVAQMDVDYIEHAKSMVKMFNEYPVKNHENTSHA